MMIKPAPYSSRVCPMGASRAGTTMMSAMVLGIVLNACPLLAQIDGGSPWVTPWKGPVPGHGLLHPSGTPGRTVAARQPPGTLVAPRVQATTEHLPATPVHHAEQAAPWSDAAGPTQPSARQWTRPDASEISVGANQFGHACDGNACLVEGYPYGYGPCSAPLHNRLWVRSEYLLWWTPGSTLPPLVTTSTPGTDPSESGVLGLPGTSILFGNGSVNTGANSGWRIALGYWLDDGQNIAIEAGYLGFGEEAARFSASSSETPILARPFYDTQLNLDSAMLVTHPDFLEGWLRCDVTSRFQAVEVLLRRNLFRQACRRVDGLVGWRFAGLDETVRIDHFSRWTQQQGPVEVGTTKSLYDLFDAQNRFNGVTLGVAYRERVGRWSLEAVMKLGLGSTRSRVLIDGATTTTVPGDEEIDTIGGALLAQDTNMGRHSRNQFAVLPELGIMLGCDLTPRLHATFGYTFLYWSQVARPANQIDTNASQLPDEPPTGSRQPAFAFTMSDYWAQGMNFGLEYRF